MNDVGDVLSVKGLLEELTNDRDYLISEMSGTFDYEKLINGGARLGEINNLIHKLTEIHIQQGIELQERNKYSESRESVIASLNEELHKVKSDNHLLQLFIENNVNEDKRREILK